MDDIMMEKWETLSLFIVITLFFLHVSMVGFYVTVYNYFTKGKRENKDSCLISMPCRLITIVDKHDKLDTKRNSIFDSLLPNIYYIKENNKI